MRQRDSGRRMRCGEGYTVNFENIVFMIKYVY